MESHSSDDSSAPPPPPRSELVRFAIETMETGLNMTLVAPLGQGTFGDVYRMRDPDRRCDIAAKIVVPANTIGTESNLWPKLNHPNVLTLLEVLTLNPVGVVVFVTPLMESSLHDVLYEKKFLWSKGAFGKVRQWMHEVLSALEYMAGSGMCHLDVKVDNVLISRKSRAVLCDFSFVNRTDEPLDRYTLGLPHIYRPPEACQSLKEEVRVNGVAYDMWGYGIMSLEILTHFVIATSKQGCGNWMEDIYPLLFHTLQDEQLGSLITLAFPADIKEIDLNLASDFLHSFLWTDASKRPSPSFAMKHSFLKHGHVISFTKDEIWINKLQYFKIKTPKPDISLKRSYTSGTSDHSDSYTDTSDSESDSSNDESLYSDGDITEGLLYPDSDSSGDVPIASNLDLPSVSDWFSEEKSPCLEQIRSPPHTSERSESNISPFDHHQNEESCDSVSLVQSSQFGSTRDEIGKSLVSLDRIKEDSYAVNRSRSFPLISKHKRSIHHSYPSLKFSSRENMSCHTDLSSYCEMIKSNNERNEIVVQMSYGSGDTKVIETGRSNKHDMLSLSNDNIESSKKDFVSFEVKPDGFLANSGIFKSPSSLSIHNLELTPEKNLDEKYTHIENALRETFFIGSVNGTAMSTLESNQFDENRFTEEPIKNNDLLMKETSVKFVSQSVPDLPVTKTIDTKSSEALKISASFQTELGNNNAGSFSENKLDGKDAKGNEEEILLISEENRITEPSTRSLKSDLSNEGCSNDTDGKHSKEPAARKMINWFGRRCFPLRCGLKRSSRKLK